MGRRRGCGALREHGQPRAGSVDALAGRAGEPPVLRSLERRHRGVRLRLRLQRGRRLVQRRGRGVCVTRARRIPGRDSMVAGRRNIEQLAERRLAQCRGAPGRGGLPHRGRCDVDRLLFDPAAVERHHWRLYGVRRERELARRCRGRPGRDIDVCGERVHDRRSRARPVRDGRVRRGCQLHRAGPGSDIDRRLASHRIGRGRQDPAVHGDRV